MRFIILAFLLASPPLYAQPKNPFLSLKYDRVVICDFENDGEHGSPLTDSKGKLSPMVTKSAQLSSPAIGSLVLKLGDKRSYGQPRAACFEPHFGIIFFKSAVAVAEIQICLTCNELAPSFDIPAQDQGKTGHGKEVYYTKDGMSKPFRKYINDLIRKYHFSHEIVAGYL
jgi:hypothetical protein